MEAVSYTHLDVYKRQDFSTMRHAPFAPTSPNAARGRAIPSQQAPCPQAADRAQPFARIRHVRPRLLRDGALPFARVHHMQPRMTRRDTVYFRSNSMSFWMVSA